MRRKCGPLPRGLALTVWTLSLAWGCNQTFEFEVPGTGGSPAVLQGSGGTAPTMVPTLPDNPLSAGASPVTEPPPVAGMAGTPAEAGAAGAEAGGGAAVGGVGGASGDEDAGLAGGGTGPAVTCASSPECTDPAALFCLIAEQRCVQCLVDDDCPDGVDDCDPVGYFCTES